MNHKHPQRMNNDDKTAPSAFEQQLRRLTPKPSETGEAETMYACGFQAGRQSVLAEMSANQSPQTAVAWRPLVLAACFSCLMVGPIGFWLGNANSTGNLDAVAVSAAPIDEAMLGQVADQAADEKSTRDSVQEPASVPPTQLQAKTPTSDAPMDDERVEPSRRGEQFLAVNSLSHLWQTLVGAPDHQVASDRARPQHLTSRSITNLQSILDQLDTASFRNMEASAFGGNSSADDSLQTSAAQRLRHPDGFRLPLSNPKSTKDIMQWLN